MIAVGILGSSTVSADDLTIPNTFTAGTPARAAEVNANFTAVEASVDDNAANITTNTTKIAANATSIQSLSATVASMSGGTGLSVLFYNGTPPGNSCEFAHMPSQRRYRWVPAGQAIYVSNLGLAEAWPILWNILTIEDSQAALVDLMIRIGNMPLVVDDFRDPSTNEFDCTTEKLLSLL